MRKLVILLIFAPVISFGQIQSFFGEKFTVTETKDLINLQDNIQIKGEIKSTCKMKGCWMELDVEEKTIFVRFKDYSFFVPKEGAEGKLAVVNGKLSIDTLSVAQLKHYAEDAGKSKEEISLIDKEEIKMSFLAEGVIIMN
ncbi:MAG: DUF4920 domain-containing protein [Flavobacteriaceae bacterium]|nr:DUF4920 domain-containing protein [Flavobacteriaceae bacterium]|tara:strand:- start:11326 stop:11748 length:423 start_codon:yes stop_codon:yes gene_type:complete